MGAVIQQPPVWWCLCANENVLQLTVNAHLRCPTTPTSFITLLTLGLLSSSDHQDSKSLIGSDEYVHVKPFSESSEGQRDARWAFHSYSLILTCVLPSNGSQLLLCVWPPLMYLSHWITSLQSERYCFSCYLNFLCQSIIFHWSLSWGRWKEQRAW